MVRLGNVFVDLNCVAAIEPWPYDAPDSAGCTITLAGGSLLRSTASMEEAERVLKQAGLIENKDPKPPEPIMLSESERKELIELYDDDFCYIARDENGSAFAYVDKPTKGIRTWLNDDSKSKVVRLKGEYAFLSFDDPAPLNIVALLYVHMHSRG